jgi:SEFIR domain.
MHGPSPGSIDEGTRPPRVFISYSHDSPEHADRVLDLSDRLRRDGVESVLDQYLVSPPEGWPLWMDRQIEECDFVLLVCTETYHRRVTGREEAGKGLGVRWEGMLVYQHLYDQACANTRFIPILFTPWATEFIPKPVKGGLFYFVDAGDGYERLFQHLTARPKVAPPVAPQIRQWRRDPDQAGQFAEMRQLAGVFVRSADDGKAAASNPPHLSLARWHGRRRPVRSDLDLLNPFSRAVPLIGRQAELSELTAWLTGPAAIAARCLIGRAGSGKTRLAIELCDWAEAREWQAGFVDLTELGRFHRQQNLSDWGWQRPTLAVIDGAAASARMLRRWLVELVYNPGFEDRPLRLLLLERHADRKLGWWPDLVTPRNFQEDGLQDLFDPPEPWLLPSISETSDRRRLEAAGHAAAAVRRGDRDAVQPPSPMTPPCEGIGGIDPGVEPLYLLMSAITTTTASSPVAAGRTALAQQIARFELGRIETLATDRQIKGEFLCHMAGFITLAGGLATHRLPSVIAGEQVALQWHGAGDPPEIAEALGDALTEMQAENGRRMCPISPDLIGEATIIALFEKQPPEVQLAIVRRAFAAGGRECLAKVVRAVQDFADSRQHPSLLWLQTFVEQAGDAAALMAISDQLPKRTTSMMENAVEIERRLVEAQRSVTASDASAKAQLALARGLTRLASRLRDVCHFEEALDAATEAVAIFRACRDSDGQSSPSAGLAEALLGLGGAASDLGQREAALAASTEAVGLLREPQAATGRSLALALSVMAGHLSDLGRRNEALAVAEDSVALHRTLAAEHPEFETPPLAMALLNLAYCRSDMGQVTDALAAAEESVALLTAFARTKPDEFLPGYAQALNSAAAYLARVGRLDEALERSREAIAIQRSMTEGCAEAHRPGLALMLNTFANARWQADDKAGALAALEEAVGLLTTLAAERPQAYNAELAKQLNNLSILLASQDQLSRALAIGNEAVHLLRDAAARRPDRHEESLATALIALAFAQRAAGDVGDMLACATESVVIFRRLANRWPELFRHRLARSLLAQSEALRALGRDQEADLAAQESGRLREG